MYRSDGCFREQYSFPHRRHSVIVIIGWQTMSIRIGHASVKTALVINVDAYKVVIITLVEIKILLQQGG